ncbi:MAG: hypothetical protein AAF593_01645 [Planctomycetota bacterium]
MIKFRCNNCQKKIGVKVEYAGRAIKCPSCETRLTVPQPQPAPAPMPAEAPAADLPDLAGLAALEAAAEPTQVRTAEAPGRQCPACGFGLAKTAVLCTNCGYSFMKGGQKLDTKIAKAEVGGGDSGRTPTVGGTGRMALGLTAASAVGVVSCVVWLLIMLFAGAELGLLAWGIGGLIGLTAGLIGRNPSPIYCGLTAGIAAVSILGAKAVVAGVVTLGVMGMAMMEDWGMISSLEHHAVMLQMVDDGELTGTEAEYAQFEARTFFGDELTDAEYARYDEVYDAWETVDPMVVERTAAMSEAEQEAAVAAASAQYSHLDFDTLRADQSELDEFTAGGMSDSFGGNFLATFGLLDLLFFGLAIATAYSVAYKQGA